MRLFRTHLAFGPQTIKSPKIPNRLGSGFEPQLDALEVK